MAQHSDSGVPGSPGNDDEAAAEILGLLRAHREADRGMRLRVRADLELGPRDLSALRLLLAARASRRTLRQKDLADALGITGASTSTMVDRLAGAGFARRIPHPEDRRSVAVVPTDRAEAAVRTTMAPVDARLREVVRSFSPAEREVVARFLRDINDALA